MEQTLRQMAGQIMIQALAAVQPDAAVRSTLEQAELSGRVYLVAIGKAAWQMANAAYQTLSARITDGVVITKHGHSRGAIGSLAIFEAGHPVADAASFAATRHALALTERLTAEDTVLFLVSGGGSSLFELPFITPEEQQRITRELLACGADIVEMNTIRKRLSRVKAGRFAQHCAPARVFSIVLSDIVGDPLDMIASGPAYPDASTAEQALAIVKKYALHLSDEALSCLEAPTPNHLSNVETHITGSVRALCAAAQGAAQKLGFQCRMLTDCLDCEAREAGRFLASIARSHQQTERPLAFFAGGETVVHLTGQGLGGRNQELALAAAPGLRGTQNTAVCSFGSDGTDGPTDAAGGFVDQSSDAAHPCGDKRWEVLRTGMDFRLRCLGCGHEVMLPRSKAEKNIRQVLRDGAPV